MGTAASCAALDRELATSIDANDTSLDIRLEELVKQAEKCATSRENLGLKKLYDEELDNLGTTFYNVSARLDRTDSTNDDTGRAMAKALNGLQPTL